MNKVFDIETESLLEKDMPFLPEWWNDEVGQPPEFTSRFTADIEKREEDISAKRRQWLLDEANKLSSKRQDFFDTAALSPDFGRITAVGIGFSTPENVDQFEALHFSEEELEQDMIETLLVEIGRTIEKGDRVAGYNLFGFDFPFLYWRSCVLGVDKNLIKYAGISFHPKWGIQVDPSVFDLMTIAKARPMRGDRSGMHYDRLSNVAKALGVGDKDDVGGSFSRMSREEKETYLRNDVVITRAVAKKLLPFF